MASIWLEEVPAWAKISTALVFALPMGFIAVDMARKHIADNACNITAAEWSRSTSQGELFRRNETEHFAKLYRSFKLACPKGHDLVNEDEIPTAVKTRPAPEQK